MAFRIKKLPPDRALNIINETQTSLADAHEALNDNLGWQNEGLKELLALPNAPQEEVSAYKKDIENIKKFARNMEEKLKRIKNITEQKESLFLCISKTTPQGEIKTLMTEIERTLKNTQNPAKIQFLETVRETAETCKELISQSAPFDDQYIPLLMHEQKYARTLITNKQLDALKQAPDTISSYFSNIKSIYNQAVDNQTMLGFTEQERAFMKTLVAEIETAFDAPLPTLEHPYERLQTALHTKMNELINDLDTNTSYSYAFKKFINHLCTKIKIVSPLFSATEIKESMAQKFKEIKTELQSNKSTEQSMDDTMEEGTVSPMHKGSSD